jgi:hypothetical protein
MYSSPQNGGDSDRSVSTSAPNVGSQTLGIYVFLMVLVAWQRGGFEMVDLIRSLAPGRVRMCHIEDLTKCVLLKFH